MTEAARGRGARWSAAALAAPVAAGLFAGATAWTQGHDPLASAAPTSTATTAAAPSVDPSLAALRHALGVNSLALRDLERRVAAVKAQAAKLSGHKGTSSSAHPSKAAGGHGATSGSASSTSTRSTTHSTGSGSSSGSGVSSGSGSNSGSGSTSGSGGTTSKPAPKPAPNPAPKPSPKPVVVTPAPAPSPTPPPAHTGTGSSGSHP